MTRCSWMARTTTDGRFRAMIGATAITCLGIGATLIAHVDDPKALETVVKYEGPGYRAGTSDPTLAQGFPASGITLNAWLPIGDFAGSHANANDCWGYVSPSGREYALLGLWGGTGIVEITDPDNPVVVETILGSGSLWGDIKTYGHYAYKVTEDGSGIGIQVIDLCDVDNGVVTEANAITGAPGNASHNIVIDTDSGFLYRVGGSFGGTGIYDLNVDPVDPPFVGSWSGHYIHDAQVVTYTNGPYAGQQIMFACGGSNGGWLFPGVAILDVTDKNNIVELSMALCNDCGYVHQAWLSEDMTTLYMNDEFDEAQNGIPTTTRVVDVTDLENPVFMPSFTNGSPAIDHNLYVKGDFIFEANYTSGLRVYDASSGPPVEIAYFDTIPDNDNVSYSGLWSNYPFFPSGRVVGSDRGQGLFVMTVDGLANPCEGDLDDNDTVDVADLLIMLAAWGTSGPGDLNNSGAVDVADVLILLAAWGSCG